jgi:SNF2 family DNA or RNA helicase
MQGLVNLLERIKKQGEKALVFARSVPTQRLLAHVLSQHFSVPVDVINGQTGMDVGNRRRAGEVRRRMLNQFQQREGFAVIVLSPFVAGVGLTLVEANHVFHYGRWWNPAVEMQAADRAHRIGQKNPVTIYRLITANTVEARVVELHAHKRALADAILEATSNTRLSATDLTNLFKG